MIGNLYVIRNNENNKIYVGKCYYPLSQRMKDHINKAKRNLCKDEDGNYRLHTAMHEIGYDNFTIELIGRFRQGLLEEKEIEYIRKYDSFKNGYNASLGGDNPATVNIGKEKDIIFQYCVQKLPINQIEMNLNISAHTIKTVLASRYIFAKNIYSVKPKTWIAKVNPTTGEWIGLYASVTEAALSVGNKQCDSHIIKCCKGKRKMAYGFSWAYA